jgi:hypothetical protein
MMGEICMIDEDYNLTNIFFVSNNFCQAEFNHKFVKTLFLSSNQNISDALIQKEVVKYSEKYIEPIFGSIYSDMMNYYFEIFNFEDSDLIKNTFHSFYGNTNTNRYSGGCILCETSFY